MVKMKKKKFRVFYFVGGDEFGSREKRKSITIQAVSEYEAEYIFKHSGYFYDSFGWVEEI